ncbi:MAG: GtrA family protein [Mediterranea sp.]|jgi:putative flippase GtrA|nr:GtrA family protein [Mediterranea sp.]
MPLPLWNKLKGTFFNKTFLRFAIVGVVNTLFGVGLYCLFIYLGVPYRLAVLLSTVLGVLFNFKTIGTFVFRNKDNRLLFRFVLAYVVAYFVNIGIIHLLLLTTSLGEYWAGIIATPAVAIVSFLLQKRFVFRH